MSKVLSIFKKGLFIVLPLLLIIFILRIGIGFLVSVLEPITKLLPTGSFFGFDLVNLTSLLIFIIIIFAVGFMFNTKDDFSFIKKIEFFIPGYSVVKNLITEEKVNGNSKVIKSCLATLDEAWLFGFILEEGKDGIHTVFIPSSPTPTSGNVYFFTEQQIKRLDIPPKELIKCITQLGVGSEKLLQGKVKW